MQFTVCRCQLVTEFWCWKPKIVQIWLFLHKHVTNGGSIPGSSQLWETYLPKLLPEIESMVGSLVSDISNFIIILDEMTDNTDPVVLDILFKLPNCEKPVLVETCMLDSNISHRAVAQAEVGVLGKYKIRINKNTIDATAICIDWRWRILYNTRSSATAENTARQLPTWRGLSPPVHSPYPFWLHLCVRSNLKPATNVLQACRP